MVKVSYDLKINTVNIEFIGKVSVAEAYEAYFELENVLPKQPGFKVLTDFTLAEGLDLEGKGAVERTMDLINSRGVSEIIRVIPDPTVDIGFNIMSAFHYSKEVKVLTVPTRLEAQAQLKES
jgi:hypothetical protein